MKSTLSIANEIFYQPSSALTASWYQQPRAVRRRQAAARLRPTALEPDERKQEAVCSVILVLCTLFSLGVCIVQFAIS